MIRTSLRPRVRNSVRPRFMIRFRPRVSIVVMVSLMLLSCIQQS